MMLIPKQWFTEAEATQVQEWFPPSDAADVEFDHYQCPSLVLGEPYRIRAAGDHLVGEHR